MGAHIDRNGQFQSDKYPTCPPGKVPLSVKDVTAQDLLWRYAQRRRAVDAEFADDLEHALKAEGYEPTDHAGSCGCVFCDMALPRLTTISDAWVHRTSQGMKPCTRP